MLDKIDRWLAHMDNYLFFNPFMKKIKQKRCKNCIHSYIRGNVFACNKSGIYIQPLRLICFRKKCDKRAEK